MEISENTKISQLIKANPASTEAIACINSRFRKITSSFLWRVFSPFFTIRGAAKIGGSNVREFYKRLSLLGFKINDSSYCPACDSDDADGEEEMDFDQILDVRKRTDVGIDAFNEVVTKVNGLKLSEILLLINYLEPVTLIQALDKKDFEIHVLKKDDRLWYTYIKRI